MLFSQKAAELKEFIEFNKRQRITDAEESDNSIKITKKPILTNEEKLIRSKEAQRKFREENREEYNAKKREYHEQHKDEINARRRSVSGQQKIIQNEKRNARRWQSIEETRLMMRINYWKLQQKALALRIFENRLNSLYNQQLQQVLPTISLS